MNYSFEYLSPQMTHEELKEYFHSLNWEQKERDRELEDEEIEDAEEYLRCLGYISLEESQQKKNELFDK